MGEMGDINNFVETGRQLSLGGVRGRSRGGGERQKRLKEKNRKF